MELKDYQTGVLDRFGRWLDALEIARQTSEKLVSALGGEAGGAVADTVRNYPKLAWQELAKAGEVAPTAGDYVTRTDGAGRSIPHVCLKVPTGGGKTLLAASALERLNRQTGLTLWITPTKAIYRQTKEALWNRQHPYRQMLARASGGRVKMMEKDVPFSRGDVANYLCVMLLMLPAANRRKGREFLRIFRDSGRYPTLFPDGDDLGSDVRLLKAHPDLDRGKDGLVKHSLFNAVKMLRPVVVLDEAHKAYGAKSMAANAEFASSVSRLNPRLVLELSATPNRGISNLLVDVTGVELKAEEMIKLPVRVESFVGAEWQYTLAQACEQLGHLEGEAQALHDDEGTYIRPIAVVRVERTGKDQRGAGRIHAEDVREYLVHNLGVPAREVAVKSAEQDELAGVDLLSEYSPVRWIVTKAALMEGWDCPFAYLLVMLDNTTAQRALTQLVGRVMRQPYARRTGVPALDQCYVYCWNVRVGTAVAQVKNGLEAEGLTGISEQVAAAEDVLQRVPIKRRARFGDQDIFLPMVLHKEGEDWAKLDYRRHILPFIDWDAMRVQAPDRSAPDVAGRQSATVDIGDSAPVVGSAQAVPIDKTLKLSWFARRLSEIVPNPWQAARMAQEAIDELRESGESDDLIFDRRSYIVFALRSRIADAIERRAEQVFRDKLGVGDIRFDLEAGKPNFRMVDNYEIALAKDDTGILARNDGQPIQMSLFEPIYESEFDSDLERNFARYLDEQRALQWWHRVAARQQDGYYLHGWKKDRIWPDFVAMASRASDPSHVLVFETKGRHLRDNPDTDYKRRVLDTLEGAFNCGRMVVRDGPARGTFRLIFDEAEFPGVLAGAESSGALAGLDA